ncbi:Helix-turn-helix domain protein (plasmid) [Streptomyces sp. YIM 121038]|uniref:helix-turn-helix domain-containing protein n=1 Tax=Streptomyces sp. YIM 121038 TaxID=2136401 RepID=UPI0011109924|nr:helix-turn-helix transcriptional regulator [Streptomyces sp. YIM 121038]QCX82951.1 Helix-turn-helix domain protein [Streptomyces sp. YIM 121038]
MDTVTAARRAFGAHLAALRKQARLTQPQLAARLCVVSGTATVTRNEISRWERGLRVPDAWLPLLAVVLNAPLEELERAAARARGELDGADERGPDAYVHDAVGWLLAHDNRHGGDRVADAAVQVWEDERRRITGTDKRQLARVAEIGEVAGWLLHDAARFPQARATLAEAHTLARLAGDAPLEWFVLDMIAMVDVHTGRPGEALAITDEVLSGRHVPGRVALMARARQGRSLAQAGDRTRALAALERAAGGLQDSIQRADPAYTWWIDPTEIAGHTGEALLSLGDPRAALPYLQQSAAVSHGGGRRDFGNILAELTALVLLGAWREAEAPLLRLEPILRTVTSSRTRVRLRSTLRAIDRDGPAWLADTAREVAAG